MKKQLLILGVLLNAALYSTSQITFQKTFQTGGGGNGFSFVQTTDGGYIAGGYTSNILGAGTADVYLVKTDSIGDTLWTRTYGGPGDDAGWNIQQTTDGGYIVVGFTSSFGAGGEDVYLIKTDSNGDTLWTKTYGGAENDRGNCVRQTTDGGYIITGFNNDVAAGGMNVYLIKTDLNGDTLWTKSFGEASGDLGTSVQQTFDGGYIITGLTYSFGAATGDVYVIKTNSAGDISWSKTYGGVDYDYGYWIEQTMDSGYIVTGLTTSFGAGDYDVYLIRTNSNGDELWNKTFGGAYEDRGRCVQQTSDSGFVISGWTYSFGSGGVDIYLIKTDEKGDVMWSKTIGGPSDDQGRFVRQTNDGGYTVTGGSFSFGAGEYDFYIIKTDADGNSGCYQTNAQTIETVPATQIISNATTLYTSTVTIVASTATSVGSDAEVTSLCTNVGIHENGLANILNISPNPSGGNFTVSFQNIIAQGNVEILNALGESIFVENISNEFKKEIIISNISSGIYFVKVFDEKNCYCMKIMIEKD